MSHSLAFVNGTAVNVHGKVLFELVFPVGGLIAASRIAGSLADCVWLPEGPRPSTVAALRACPRAVCAGFNSLRPHQYFLSGFCVKWHLSVVCIHISLMTSDVELLFTAHWSFASSSLERESLFRLMCC